jgi:hypothetical protein
MRKVTRDQIVDYATYEDTRDEFRKRVMASKEPRRIHLGEHVTLLFETSETVRYQVQEMLRAEKIVREAEIQHELDTYNEILGGDGELGCTLLIEIDDPELRAVKLREWLTLPHHVYAELEGGERVRAAFDPRQVGEDRVSSVQFLKFDVKGRLPVAFVLDHESLQARRVLSPDQRVALLEDLR